MRLLYFLHNVNIQILKMYNFHVLHIFKNIKCYVMFMLSLCLSKKFKLYIGKILITYLKRATKLRPTVS